MVKLYIAYTQSGLTLHVRLARDTTVSFDIYIAATVMHFSIMYQTHKIDQVYFENIEKHVMLSKIYIYFKIIISNYLLFRILLSAFLQIVIKICGFMLCALSYVYYIYYKSLCKTLKKFN